MNITLKLSPAQIVVLADALANFADNVREQDRSDVAEVKAQDACDILKQLARNASKLR